MIAAIPFPDISPEIFSVQFGQFAFALRWYAVAYIVGLLAGWRIIVTLVKRPTLWPGQRAPMAQEQVEALLTWVVLGVIFGGRLGFVLFYQPAYYLANPGQILRIWEGGMSFHGAFVGVVLGAWVFASRNGVPKLQLADAMALVTPIGLFLGRIANFINAELWGRPTTAPWGVIFPGTGAQSCGWDWPEDPCARHPTQLYEAGLEGLVLGLALIWLVRRGWLTRPGTIAGVFFGGYGAARFIVEFWRQADAQFITAHNPLGHVLRLGDWGLSMGQLLSLPMIAAGLALIWLAQRKAGT